MAKVFIEESSLTAIGEAIRSKTGKTDLLSPASMASEITNITTGGGGDVEEIVLSGNCSYACANPAWNALFDKVRTENINNANHMFSGNELESIPFDINFHSECRDIGYMYYSMPHITTLPKMKGNLRAPESTYDGVNMQYIFAASPLKEIPYDFFFNFGGNAFWEASKLYGGSRSTMFYACLKLRNLPNIAMLENVPTSYSQSLYNTMCSTCYALDAVYDLPVLKASITSNMFRSTVDSCSHLKDFTFATQADGTPYSVAWGKQTLDLSYDVGYHPYNRYQMVEQGGLSYDDEITDDATYAALKDNPDAWTALSDYSRYDKASALRTINSLPIVTGTGNTIKFNGVCGAKTDGGAINTLTEEEIAIAAAKGWTISFV